MKIRLFLFTLFCIPLLSFMAFLLLFKNANSIELMTIAKPDTQISSQLSVSLPAACIMQSGDKSIDNNGEIGLLIWNIQKQTQQRWMRDLSDYSEGLQLALLQETLFTQELAHWIKLRRLSATQVNAFSIQGESAGVMTIARENPSSSCGSTQIEPLIRLNKSTLISYFSLTNGTSLAVVNIHGINFTLGVEDYQRQIKSVLQQLYDHKGPLIVAGDFNDWNESRRSVVRELVQSLELIEADYAPDNRVEPSISDAPIDHLFYRQLEFKQAFVSLTQSSDHNPIIARFHLN
jgi:endonuclease/exonuclease/phosphatase (EEP) superfamily protein YafD